LPRARHVAIGFERNRVLDPHPIASAPVPNFPIVSAARAANRLRSTGRFHDGPGILTPCVGLAPRGRRAIAYMFSDSLKSKTASLETWETQQYSSGLFGRS